MIVYEQQGSTHIAAVDAEPMLALVGNDDLTETATEVRRRLAGVVERAAHAQQPDAV